MLRTTAFSAARLTVARPVALQARFLGSRSNEGPLEPGFVEQYKLNDPSRFVPIALGSGLFASLTGLYVRV